MNCHFPPFSVCPVSVQHSFECLFLSVGTWIDFCPFELPLKLSIQTAMHSMCWCKPTYHLSKFVHFWCQQNKWGWSPTCTCICTSGQLSKQMHGNTLSNTHIHVHVHGCAVVCDGQVSEHLRKGAHVKSSSHWFSHPESNTLLVFLLLSKEAIQTTLQNPLNISLTSVRSSVTFLNGHC